ncbi:polysaccharide lyase family 1 protein [Bacteroides ovatus]|uniref:pectate lyase family protein n=1 Tax=Bacteroides ovatus TaxID=28116 RepID=UPI001F21ACD8|nr:pectate lyase [Bacteroides ovatus]MCE8921013.1 pectate lyase [Bacteroides ovatus]
MRNTATFQKKTYPIAVRCLTSILYFFLFSLSSLAACVDKEPVDEEDADPAINPHSSFLEDEESGGSTSSGPAFPNFANNAPAFPGAVGHGRNSEGARASSNREVYVVTNLNNSGAGSFRDAVSQSNRIIVFNVSGLIDLNKEVLVFKDNQTILCQTAPAPGIVLYNGRTSSTNADNVIVRYLRMRAGRQVSSSDNIDAGGAAYGHDQIYDHCSFTWGTDECFSLNNDKQPERLYNITLQNSILGQGCQNHSCGGLIQTGEKDGITIFRNLLIDNKTRNFKVKGLNQYVNNIIYNWGNGTAYDAGGESAGTSNTVIENNYFIKGPAWTWQNFAEVDVDPSIIGDEEQCRKSGDGYYEVKYQVNPAKPLTGGGGTGTFFSYCVGNYYDEDKDGTLNGFELTQSNWNTYCSAVIDRLSAPDALHPTISSTTSATEAYYWVVENVGPVLPERDAVDKFLISELTSLGIEGMIFRNQTIERQYPLANIWNAEFAVSVTGPIDTDSDGIPDDFEDKWGLNKNNAGDAVRIAENGYTMIENYALSLEFPDEYEKAWKEAYGE